MPGEIFSDPEGRDSIGGLGLFKYPGIQSDSDMYTLGFHSAAGENHCRRAVHHVVSARRG